MILSNLSWPKIETISFSDDSHSEIQTLIYISIDYYNLRDLDTSFNLLKQAFNKYLFSDTPNYRLKAVILNNFAAIHQMRSEFIEALSLIQESIEIKENHLGFFSECLVLGYGNLSLVLSSLGKYFLSKESAEKGLALLRNQEIENKDLASWLNDLQGIANSGISKFYDAQANFEEALKLKSQFATDGELELALIHNNLSVLLENFEMRQEAIKTIESVIKIFQKNHYTNLYEIEKTSLYCNLNIMKFMLGKESPQFCNNQIDQSLAKVPERDILRGRIYINCANFIDEYAATSKESLILKGKCLALYYQTFQGESHPDFVKIYEAIGNGLMRNWVSDSSLEFLMKSLQIAKQTIGYIHPFTAKVCQRLGILAQREGNYPRKLEFFIEALEIYEKCFGINSHPQIARIHNNIGFTYTAIHDYRQALRSHINAMKVKSKFHSLNDKKMAINYWNIGMVFRMNSVLEYGIQVIQKSRTGYKLLNMQTEDVEVCERNIRTMNEDNTKNKVMFDQV